MEEKKGKTQSAFSLQNAQERKAEERAEQGQFSAEQERSELLRQADGRPSAEGEEPKKASEKGGKADRPRIEMIVTPQREVVFVYGKGGGRAAHSPEEANALLKEKAEGCLREKEPEIRSDLKLFAILSIVCLVYGGICCITALVLTFLLDWAFIVILIPAAILFLIGFRLRIVWKRKKREEKLLLSAANLYVAKVLDANKGPVRSKISYTFFADGTKLSHKAEILSKRQYDLYGIASKRLLIVAYDANLKKSLPVRIFEREGEKT